MLEWENNGACQKTIKQYLQKSLDLLLKDAGASASHLTKDALNFLHIVLSRLSEFAEILSL